MMTDPKSSHRPVGAGFFFVAALLSGVVAGLIAGQPTIGFLAGGVVGAAILLVTWLRSRR